jgi:FAD dependent oxidoreductase TIGR03364
MTKPHFDVAVIGAGVLGTFHAYFACEKGLNVLLIERSAWPGQASVRNFGMLIPSGMTPGDWHRRALESAAIYRELAGRLTFPLQQGGTLYLATTPGEVTVLEEFARLGPAQGYRCELFDGPRAAALNPAVDPRNCLAGLHFPDDMRLQPRSMLWELIAWLVNERGCVYAQQTVAIRAEVEGDSCRIDTASGQTYRARHVFVCSGADLRTLFPEHFTRQGLQLCKLQMLRTVPQAGLRLPTSLASGLTLRRYPSFRLCPSWARLADEAVAPELAQRGIHVLIVQEDDGRLVIGDSHEYRPADYGDLDECLDATTEALILDEARRLVRLPCWDVAERWHGIYTLHPKHEAVEETIDGRIHLVTGIGGKGMTTGPAVARESLERIDWSEERDEG